MWCVASKKTEMVYLHSGPAGELDIRLAVNHVCNSECSVRAKVCQNYQTREAILAVCTKIVLHVLSNLISSSDEPL